MKNMLLRYLSITVLLTVNTLISLADHGKINADSTIQSVTVYPGRAEINREFKTHLEIGRRTIIFQHLPLGLDDKSVRVSGNGSASVKILDFQVKLSTLTEAFQEKAKIWDKQFNSILRELRQLSDRKTALMKKKEFLENLMKKSIEESSGEGSQKSPLKSLTDYKNMMDFLEKNLNEIFSKNREIEEKIKALEEKKLKVEQTKNRDKNAYAKQEKRVVLELDVLKAGTMTASISYLINNAAWKPKYDLRLYSVDPGRDVLVYSAIVSQQSGEDWKNVRLNLSTANPMEKHELPDLIPVYLSLYDAGEGTVGGIVNFDDGLGAPGVSMTVTGGGRKTIEVISDVDGKYFFPGLPAGRYNVEAKLTGFNTIRYRNVKVLAGKMTKLDFKLQMSSIREEIVIEPTETFVELKGIPGSKRPSIVSNSLITETTRIDEGFLSTAFKIKYRDTILSGSEGKKVTVAMDNVTVEKEYIAIPKESESVFFRARMKNTSSAPLLAGPINVFFDGILVDTTNINTKYQGETFEVPIGIDERIEIKRNLLENKARSKGLFKKIKIIPSGYTIAVKNKKKEMVQLNVKDLIPVSLNDKVNVEIKKMIPKPLKHDKKKGILTWLISLNPGEKKEIKVQYEVSHPIGKILEQQKQVGDE